MNVRFISSTLLLLGSMAWAQDSSKREMQEMHRLHQDSKAYIAMLEDPKRDAYQKPHEVVMALDLKEGEMIADIGAGSGYFAFRFAHHVGDKGRVYAVDISPEMVVHMNRRARDMKVKNLTTVLAAPEDPLLLDASIDRFFICDTWHHIENQPQYLDLLKKMLKPGGQVIMIDFQKKETPTGPPMEMRIAREDLLRQMETNGFKVVKEHTFLPYQYFLVFGVGKPPAAKIGGRSVGAAPNGVAKGAAVKLPRDLSGAWPGVFYLPNGEIKLMLNLNQDGGNIAGTLGAEMGTLPIRAPTLENDTLRFQIDLFGNSYRFEGTIEDEKLAGTWFANGAWKAEREKGDRHPFPFIQ